METNQKSDDSKFDEKCIDNSGEFLAALTNQSLLIAVCRLLSTDLVSLLIMFSFSLS